jgi:dihydroxy-acid dehydratase
MKRKLRSNFEYGTFRWAVRRAQWRTLGLSDADLEKPKIAVVNSSSELASCFSHLDGVAAELKAAIRAAGGVPFEVRTAAPSDFITSAGHRGGYILAARDLIPNEIEVAVEGAMLDGMVCLASCDKTAPGQLMAAARLDIPTVIVPCGYQKSGEYRGKHLDIEDVFVKAMHVFAGKLSKDELAAMSENAIRGPGVCSGMGTANSMHVVSEALGMALPGSAPVAANSPKMMAHVRAAGARIVDMVWQDLRPRAILTPAAFANAAMTVLAVGGSINTMKHMQAVAIEAQLTVDIYALFEELSRKVPVLSAVRPNGERSIEEFEAAGGTRALMKRLEGMLHREALGVTGRTLGEELREAAVVGDEVIRPVERPVARRPAVLVLRGNLAADGAIMKFGIDPDKATRFAGPAIVFESVDAALEGVRAGAIRRGQTVVLRGLGVTGTPGMGGASRVVFALDGAGLGDHVAVVTDGHLSGLVNKGLVVGEVSPEAATGGPIALVENGDRIAIDIEARTVDLDLPEAELAARRARLHAPAASQEKGWLGIYLRNVAPLPKGGVLTLPK